MSATAQFVRPNNDMLLSRPPASCGFLFAAPRARPGTGGSHGVEYLRTTLDKRFFGELWDVRSAL